MAEMITLITTILLAVIRESVIVLAVWLPVRLISRAIWFSTRRPGTATPADAGLTYSEHWISNGKRRLQAWLVRAANHAGPDTVVLLFQGGSRVISELVGAQEYLYDHAVSSMVFDFGGNGNSTGEVSREAIRDDGVAAFHKLQELVGTDTRIFLCGFSRSAGRLLAAISESHIEADGVILIGAYTTTRDVMLARCHWMPRWIGERLFPTYWDNLTAIRSVRCPVLLVHSTDDELVPIAQSRKLCEVNNALIRLVAVIGLKHDDSLHPLHEEYWNPIFEFIEHGA